MFPPVPDFDSLHPLVVHFPVALLLTAPILVLLALLVPRHRAGLSLGALTIMVLGTIAAYVAVASGEAAAELAERTPEVAAVLEEHEELAESARLVFTILTVIFAAIVALPMVIRRKLPKAVLPATYLVFLLVYSAGTLLLANTAHNGGLLVHKHGVHAVF